PPLGPAAIRRDHLLAALLVERDAEIARIVGLVREQTAREHAADEVLGRHDIVALALGDLERERQTQRIYDQVHLRGQTSTRATNSFSRRPPFPPAPPAACW